MFKITVYSHGQSKEHTFERKSRIVFGKVGSNDVDLFLEGENVSAQHLTLETTDQDSILYNTSNDPFATINGEPFGKRKLRNNDIVQVGQTTFRFQYLQESPLENQQASPAPLENILDSAIQSKKTNDSTPSFQTTNIDHLEKELEEIKNSYDLPLNDEHPLFSQDDLEIDEIESLVREVEAMEWEEVQALSSSEVSVGAHSFQKAPSPYLPSSPAFAGNKTSSEAPPTRQTSNTEEESKKKLPKASEPVKQPANQAPSKPPVTLSINWKWWLVLSLLTLLLLFLVGGSFYYHMQDKRRLEETKASQGVADIAMALMYAHVNQITPPNQNWSNPAFLKKNLGAVLSSKYQILATIDAHGQFSNSPYLLRIYPNKDLSQFIVIAQPAPSPLQSIFPRTTIIVDSKEMELRKLKDLRELNRVLATAKPFENFDTNSSSAIIKSGELIPLNSITLSNSKLGFSPPRSLAVLRPGADNRIYNAPRYYLFGERILNKIISFENEGYSNASTTATSVLQDLNQLGTLPNLVLYSTQGMTKALHAQRALATISPENKLLVGYLKLNSEGKVLSSQLLMKHALTSTSWQKNRLDTEIAIKDVKEPLFAKETELPPLNQFQAALQSIQHTRKEKLSEQVNEIKTLLDNQITTPTNDFKQNFQSLSQKLISEVAVTNEENTQQLHQLISDSSDKPLEGLLNEVQTAGLGQLLTTSQSHSEDKDRLKNEFETKLNDVTEAGQLENLETALQVITQWVTLNTHLDPQLLSSFQKQTSEGVIQKLSDFLLSPTNHLPKNDLIVNKRGQLESILNLAWIKDDEVKHYYLNEFDILSSQEH